MCRLSGNFKGWSAAWILGIAIPTATRAGDVYFHQTVGDLTLTQGELPQGRESRGGSTPGNRRLQAAMQPYAALEGAGEIYLGRGDDARWPSPRPPQLDGLFRDDVVALRVPEAREITGRLFAPRDDGQGMVAVAFKVAPRPGQEDAQAVFARAKRRHYERLAARGLPGAAWFRHRIREAGSIQPAGPDPNVATGPETPLEQTYALFSGGRAISENLQLDRPLTQSPPAEAPRSQPPVPLDSLKGITVAEMDWTARLEGRKPALDPLAASIPADQHALFLPHLEAAAGLLAEFRDDAIPVLRLVESRSEDSQVQRRYERQLGVSFADVSRWGDRGTIRSIAVTSSDPYLPTGTDLAVLFQTEAPRALSEFLKEHVAAARQAEPGAQDVGGEMGGVSFAGVRSTDRGLSVYIATIGPVVVVTNSPVQLGRVVDASQGKLPTLAEQPEYRFFRDRYRRGEADESAFLILTDATIRRWCGPKWRIAASRRLRAAAHLAELQADHIEAIAAQTTEGDLRAPSLAGAPDLGQLRLRRAGVWSSTYGTLGFLTPIAELSLTEVEKSEASAYERWRDTYQRNWRGVFDPIAVRIATRPNWLAADVSVMPLIAGSNYRPFVELVGRAEIAPEAGDRHPEALVHAIMALDVQSPLMRSGGDLLTNLTRAPQGVALGWLGPSVAMYLDDAPFWEEMAAAEDPDQFLDRQVARLPLGLHVEVTDGVKLALFLSAVRAFVEQSAPDLVSWETREHGGRRYVRVAERENARPDASGPRFALSYATTPRSLAVALDEAVITRFLDRQGKAIPPGPEAAPWLGTSLALRASRRGFEVLGGSTKSQYRETMQLRSWGNLPILNEWKRLVPDQDPVALHVAVWGTQLVDPGGGRYVWNETWQTMESTAFGHPGEPKPGPETARPLERIRSTNFGISFQDGGLRAKAEVEVQDAP